MSKISLNKKPSQPLSNDEIIQSAVSLAVSKARTSLLSSGSTSSDYCCVMASGNVKTYNWERYNPSSPKTVSDYQPSESYEVSSDSTVKENKTEDIPDLLVSECMSMIEGSRYNWLTGSVEEEISRRLKERMSRNEVRNEDDTQDGTSNRVKALNARVSNLINEIDQTVNNFDKTEQEVVHVEEIGQAFESRPKKVSCKKVKSKPTTGCKGLSVEQEVKSKPTTGCKGLSVEQALEGVENKIFVPREITFDNWLKEKDDKEKERRLAAEQAARDKRDQREKQRVLNAIAFARWYEAAKNRPKPLPIISCLNLVPNATQSGPSLHWNPVPWVDDWHTEAPSDGKPAEPAAVKVRAKSSVGSVKQRPDWWPNPRLAGVLRQADCWIDAVLGGRRGEGRRGDRRRGSKVGCKSDTRTGSGPRRRSDVAQW